MVWNTPEDYYTPKKTPENGVPQPFDAGTEMLSKGGLTGNDPTKPSSGLKDLSVNKESGERFSDMGYFDASPSPSLDNMNKTLPFQVTNEVMEEVDKDPWYHGILPAADLEELLVNQGDFLLRQFDGDNKGTFQIAMSIRWDKLLWHFPMYSLENNGRVLYTLNNDNYFKSPTDVAKYHLNKGVAVFDNVIPLAAIPRQSWELRREHIRLEGKIGEGAFGEVWSGFLQIKKNNITLDVQVAVKLMKVTDQTRPQLEKMHQEARFLRQYNHRNVVRLHGCFFSEQDVYIVMEMVKGGALDAYVRKNPHLTPLNRASYAYDVAAGLAYLHRRNCMHRDMAARNCLVNETGKLVKLSDFGLSMRGRRFKMSETERVPIRWSAPEVLVHRVYTRESDIWSYGMVVWEVFNDGKEPFHGFDNAHIRSHICQKTFRPPIDPIQWYPEFKMLIPRCWDVDTMKRPAMDKIAASLQKYCIHEVTDKCEKKERVIVRAKEAQKKQMKANMGKMKPKGGSMERKVNSNEGKRGSFEKNMAEPQSKTPFGKNSAEAASKNPLNKGPRVQATTPTMNNQKKKRKKGSNASKQASVAGSAAGTPGQQTQKKKTVKDGSKMQLSGNDKNENQDE